MTERPTEWLGGYSLSPPPGQYKSGATISYVPTNQSIDTGAGAVGFNNRCAPQPRGDLLAFKNPTCDGM